MYTHEVRFTKNVISGPLQGAQLRMAVSFEDATVAAAFMLCLFEGVHTDGITGGAWTAECGRIVSIEEDLGAENQVDDEPRSWDRYDAADFAFDMRGDH